MVVISRVKRWFLLLLSHGRLIEEVCVCVCVSVPSIAATTLSVGGRRVCVASSLFSASRISLVSGFLSPRHTRKEEADGVLISVCRVG